jgi:DNA-binding winged helix-turn-helix (wHTH) protein
MKEAVFIINNRFIVDSFRNEVFDKETRLKSRLEPRLMKLLCILTERQGEVVKRELILKEIWADYPGANEGLNQAISFLRKLLADEDKEIIKTQPKTGYSFNSIISWKSENVPAKKRKYTRTIIIASALLLLLFLIVDRYHNKKDISTISMKELYEKDAAGIGRGDSIHQAEMMRRSNDTSGKAEMERKGRKDAGTGRKDSIHQAEKMLISKDTLGPAAKGDSIH